MTTKVKLLDDTVIIPTGSVATTQGASDNTTKVATTAYVTTALANLADSAPSTLNTLNELAAALGDDANYSTTTTNAIAAKLPLAGGTLTGNLTFNKEDPNITLSDSSSSRTLSTFVDNNNSVIRSSGQMLLQIGSESAITIGSNKKVGIGEASPLGNLHVKLQDTGASANASANLLVLEGTENGMSILSSTSGAGYILFGDSGDTAAGGMLYDHSANRIRFRTNSAWDKMSIGDGSVGIMNNVADTVASANNRPGLVVGTGSGNAGITLYASGEGAIRFADASSGAGSYAGGIDYVHSDDSIRIYGGGTGVEKMRITTAGQIRGVPLGVATPTFAFTNDTDTGMTRPTGDTLQFVTGGTARVRISSGGSLLVGRDVENSSASGHRFTSTGFAAHIVANDYPLLLNRLSSDGPLLTFRKDSSTVGAVDSYGGIIQFGQGNVNLKFSNANDAIIPANDSGSNNNAAIDLGLAGVRFKDLFLSGTANANNLAITSVSGSNKSVTITRTSGAEAVNLAEMLSHNALQILNKSGGSYLNFAGNAARTDIQAQSNSSTAEDIALNPYGGNVLIGTTTPLANSVLTVDGGIRFNHFSAGHGLNVVSNQGFNNSNTANACGSVYYKMFTINLYHNNGHTQALFLANGGGGVGYRFTSINAGDNSIRNGIQDFNLTTIGSSPNTFRIQISNGGGALTVSRTSGSGSFSVSVQVLAGG